MDQRMGVRFSDDQHVIRSTIFDLLADIEMLLRQNLYNIMKDLIFHNHDKAMNEKNLHDFGTMVNKISFGNLYAILRPILNSWPYSHLPDIGHLAQLRNDVAHHGDVTKISYKGRNPFEDGDAFAQVFFDAWEARQALIEFYHAVEDRRALCLTYEECAKQKEPNIGA